MDNNRLKSPAKWPTPLKAIVIIGVLLAVVGSGIFAWLSPLGAGSAALPGDNLQHSPVNFADPNLEAAIREAINKPQGPIYTSDLSSLTELKADNRGIADLTGIENCLNLERLDLSRNKITYIWGLAHLIRLEWLDLSYNNITNVGALDVLVNLKWLGLMGNNIDNVSQCVIEDTGVTVH